MILAYIIVFTLIGSIFSLFGSLFLLCLFLFFLYKGFSISIRAPDDFGRLLGAGIVIMIVVQSLINVAAMAGIFPLTGIPLIFVSKGGSSLIATLVEVGILLNIPLLALAAATGGGVKLFIFGIGILLLAHLFDNAVLTPLLVAKIVDVHPFIVVVATLVGGELFGFIGFVIAIPVYVIVKTLLWGMYEYIQAVQRHDILLAHEKQYQEKHTQN